MTTINDNNINNSNNASFPQHKMISTQICSQQFKQINERFNMRTLSPTPSMSLAPAVYDESLLLLACTHDFKNIF